MNDQLSAAFAKIDTYREAGMRLSEACAHASVDFQTGDWRELCSAYVASRLALSV